MSRAVYGWFLQDLEPIILKRSLGFPKTNKYNLSLKDLTALLLDDFYPIVYVELQPIDQSFGIHAMVVIDERIDDRGRSIK